MNFTNENLMNKSVAHFARNLKRKSATPEMG